MASITDNTLFLYCCLAESKHKIDWNVVGDALGLKPGTASMRWQRLKARLDKSGLTMGSVPASAVIDETTLFLYQCIIHSSCKIDFDAVGKATGLKTGTAAMRYRRMQEKIKKQHGDVTLTKSTANVQPPGTTNISKAKTTTKTKRKQKNSDYEADDEDEAVDGAEDGDVNHKRAKLQTGGTTPKRQTRGKVLDYTKMLDDSSSTGTSSAGTNVSSSTYEPSSFNGVSVGSRIPKATLGSADHAIESKSFTDRVLAVDSGTMGGFPHATAKLDRNQAGSEKTSLSHVYGSDEVLTNTGLAPDTGADDSTMDASDAASYTFKTAISGSENTPTPQSTSSLVWEDDKHHTELSELNPGMRIPKRTVPQLIESPDIEGSTEEATIMGPTSTRLQHGLIRRHVDRSVSLTPEDSISMVGQVSEKKDSDKSMPAEKKSEKSFLG